MRCFAAYLFCPPVVQQGMVVANANARSGVRYGAKLNLSGLPAIYEKAPSHFRYYCTMILDFLLKRIRRAEQNEALRHSSIEDQSLNPDSPFPEPIVIEFSDVIDLHSIPPRQVRAVVEGYLEEAQRRQVRWVRIIHGKGIGVQRETVRSILSRTPFVADFRDAPAETGGWGATIVTLAVDSENGVRE